MKKKRYVYAVSNNYDDDLAEFNADVAELESLGWQKEGGISIVGYPLVEQSTFGYRISQMMVRGREDMRLITIELTLSSLSYLTARAQTRVVKQFLTDLSVLDFIAIYNQFLSISYSDEILRWFRVISVIDVGDPTAAQVRAMDSPYHSGDVILRERNTDRLSLGDFAAILDKEEADESERSHQEIAT